MHTSTRMATNGFRIRDLPRELRNQIFGLIAINETNSGFTQPFFLTSLGEVETAHAKVLAKCTTLSHDHKMVVNLYDEALEEYRKLDIRITVDNLAAFCALKRPRDWVRSITLVWEPDINDKERYLKFMNSGFRLKYGNKLDRLTIDLTKLSENRCHCCTITKWLVDFSGRLPIEGNPTICVSLIFQQLSLCVIFSKVSKY